MGTFTTFPVADRDYATPMNEDRLDALYDRDEDLRQVPFWLPHQHEHQEPSESYVQHESWLIFVPLSMGGSGSEAGKGYIAFQMRRNGDANSAQAECKIGALTSSEADTTNTNYSTAPIFWCIFSDLSSVAGTEVTLTFWLKRTGASGGGPQALAREANGPVSYFRKG